MKRCIETEINYYINCQPCQDNVTVCLYRKRPFRELGFGLPLILASLRRLCPNDFTT